MSKRRPYIGPSEAQANADALVRRSAPYTAAADASVKVAWDWRKRQPRNLREAAIMVRALYAAEVPTKLHDGPDAIGPDGTPKMTSRAEGYIFGNPRADDANDDAIGYYHAPFRARLAEMARGSEPERKYATIVMRVSMGCFPFEAATLEGVPAWCAKLVAEDALRAFLHSMSDLRIHLPLAEGVTAA